MKGLTKTSLFEFLKILLEESQYNLQRIKINNQKINKYLQNNRNHNPFKDELVADLHQLNEALCEENIVLLNLHQDMLKINNARGWYSMEDLKQLLSGNIVISESSPKDEYVSRLQDGPTEEHPCLCKKDVLQRALNEMLKLERYEECDAIKKLMEKCSTQEVRNQEKRAGEIFSILRFRMSGK